MQQTSMFNEGIALSQLLQTAVDAPTNDKPI